MSEKDPLDGLEMAEVFAMRLIPNCQSGDAWMAPSEPGGPGFEFTLLDNGDLLVSQANLPKTFSGVPEIVLLSHGTYMAKMRRKVSARK